MKSSVKVLGIEKLAKRIANLAADLASKNRAVVKREAGEIMRVMKAKAPKHEHKLEKAITTRTWKDRDGVTGVVVGVEGGHPEFYGGTDNKSYYPASQEFGWENPEGVHHPPQPYIRPAFDERAPIAKRNIRNTYNSVIEKAGQ